MIQDSKAGQITFTTQKPKQASAIVSVIDRAFKATAL
jgi:hypothetical protein